MSPRIHERQSFMELTTAELRLKIARFLDEKDLTDAEYISVVESVLGSCIQLRTKYMLRFERHGNYDTPAGWASDDDEGGCVNCGHVQSAHSGDGCDARGCVCNGMEYEPRQPEEYE